MLFREEQTFRDASLGRSMLGLASVAVIGGVVAVVSATEMPDTYAALVGIGAASLVLVLLAAWKQVVEVHADRLVVRIRPFVHRVEPIATIRAAEARTYRPLIEYGGWGIRYGAGGWAYNVRGNRGVQVTLVDGTTYLIGSQRADELALAIERARAG